MAAHCYARRATQSKFRALQPYMSETTPGIEPPYPRFAAHLRCVSAKEGKGSQEGSSTHLIRARRGKEDSGLRPKPCLVSCPLLPQPVGTGLSAAEGRQSPRALKRLKSLSSAFFVEIPLKDQRRGHRVHILPVLFLLFPARCRISCAATVVRRSSQRCTVSPVRSSSAFASA